MISSFSIKRGRNDGNMGEKTGFLFSELCLYGLKISKNININYFSHLKYIFIHLIHFAISFEKNLKLKNFKI